VNEWRVNVIAIGYLRDEARVVIVFEVVVGIIVLLR